MHQSLFRQSKGFVSGMASFLLAGVVACSGPGGFMGILKDQSGKQTQTGFQNRSGTGASNNPNGGVLDDENEKPSIEVAGVNLTAECLDLQVRGKRENSMAVECSVGSDSEDDNPIALKFSKISVKGLNAGEAYEAVAMEADPHPTAPEELALSKNNKMSMQFEIPDTAMPELKKKSIEVTFTDLVVNGQPSSDPQPFKPRLQDYFSKDSLCATNAIEVKIPIRFALNQLHINKNTSSALVYNTRWGFIGIPDFRNSVDSSDKPVTITSDSLSGVQFCDARFENDLTFQWENDTNFNTRRIWIHLNDAGGKVPLVLTNLAPLQDVFNVSPNLLMAKLRARPAPVEQVFSRAKTTDAAQAWCVLGGSGCIDNPSSAQKQADSIRLSAIPASFLTKNIKKVLKFGTDSGMALRIVNAFNSGRVKQSCYPALAGLTKQGSALNSVEDPNDDSCDAAIPPPPTSNAVFLKVKYLQ